MLHFITYGRGWLCLCVFILSMDVYGCLWSFMVVYGRVYGRVYGHKSV